MTDLYVPISQTELDEAETYFLDKVRGLLKSRLEPQGVTVLYFVGNSNMFWLLSVKIGSGETFRIKVKMTDIRHLMASPGDFTENAANWIVQKVLGRLAEGEKPKTPAGLEQGVIVDGGGSAIQLGEQICDALGPGGLVDLQEVVGGRQ